MDEKTKRREETMRKRREETTRKREETMRKITNQLSSLSIANGSQNIPEDESKRPELYERSLKPFTFCPQVEPKFVTNEDLLSARLRLLGLPPQCTNGYI